MTSTLVHVLVFGVWVLPPMALACGFLFAAARLFKLPPLSVRRAIATVVLLGVVLYLVRLAGSLIVGQIPERQLTLMILVPVVTIVLWCVTLRGMLRTSLGKAFLASLPLLLTIFVQAMVVLAFVNPFLVEAFAVSTNPMAPTILGPHFCGKCPLCGGVAIVPESSWRAPHHQDLGICSRCLKTAKVTFDWEHELGGDRLLVEKPFEPRRWDVIAFQLPQDPSEVYISRVVGLPHEKVEIREGDIWINGARAPRPPEIAGLVYVPNPADDAQKVWGPNTLGPDEYIVLSDFSLRSKDSRFWEEGAEGHPRYAVPKSYIVGVATHIYWSPSRWRILR